MGNTGMQAVIMAGGEGSRLRPLTGNIPKPMLPVANQPLMEHIIKLLKRHGFTDIVATVQFLSSVIRNYFGDGSDLGVSLSYATEDVPLGTAGSVLGASDLLAGTFLVVSGDALTDLDLGEVVRWHRSKGAAATLVLKRMKDPLEFGIVMTAEDGRVERFLEKPSWGQVFSDTINTGIYVLEPEVLDLIPPDQPYDFSSELFPAMLDKGLPIYGFVTDGYWTDVGNSDAFLAAQRDALTGRVRLDLQGFELHPGVFVGEEAEIDPTARITGPALLGDNCTVGPGAVIGPNAVIGSNVTIGGDAHVEQGVLMDRSYLGPGARVRGGVVGPGSSLDRGATIDEGAVLGSEVTVGAGAIVNPRVKVYASRTVEAGAIVTRSVVHERSARRSLFGSRGVAGLINVGVSPETAVRLGMAYGTTLPRGSVVVTGRDASRAARTLKRALIAGLNSTGVSVRDLELVPRPLTRFTVRGDQVAGGLSVRTATTGDSDTVEIGLFGPDGADLVEAAQRKIERVYFREDYRRAGPGRLGELEFPPHALEQYTSGLLSSIDLHLVREARLKVVVDYAHGPASLVGPSLMGRLGCDALSLHAFTDEHRPVLARDDLDRLLIALGDQVTNSGADLGVLLEPSGESAYIVDDSGQLLSSIDMLLAFLGHELKRGAGHVATPVSAPLICQQMAREAGADLSLTPTSLSALMARAGRPDIDFAADGSGLLIFPRFMPAPDALMTFCKALELRAQGRDPLSDQIGRFPPVHLASRDVRTPWDQKGAVMRHVASSASSDRLILLDGVRVTEPEGWALVIPHADEPSCRIWAEGETEEALDSILDKYEALVTEVVGEGA
jgi:mannose-1-phosphate guanylyltransferase/phosphomannomutase